MIADNVRECTIFDEFSGKEQLEYFDFKDRSFLHHIDTYYYAVSINEPEDVVTLYRENRLPENLNRLLNKLRDMKAYVRGEVKQKLIEIAGMNVAAKAFSIYEFCVSLDECFDIFIASNIPTQDTPRILVQLRSRYLVLEGVWEAIKKAYVYLCDFLQGFELFPEKILINRIDYAFHTNCIDNPAKYFSDYKLEKYCKTNLTTYQKIGKTATWTIDTLNLGSRKSNNVFFRAYDKTREVIEMNYKAFFIERWRQHKLISNFDFYVYTKAYELKSFRTGVLIGRLKWYIEFGKNEDFKKECEDLIKSCYVNSDNTKFIEQKIKGVIPTPTTIVNIEFQTKRAFYKTCAKYMKSLPDDIEIYDSVKLSSLVLNEEEKIDPIFNEVYFFLRNASIVIDYLTKFGGCVAFVDDASMTLPEFKKAGGNLYRPWWLRLRQCEIDYSGGSNGQELSRSYDNAASIRKRSRSLQSSIAGLSILYEKDTKSLSFVEDVVNVMSVINDNDVSPVCVVVNENGELFEPQEYGDIRARQERRLKGITKNNKIKN